MNLKITSKADNAIEVLIEKQDYSVADIVHRELLNVKRVKFAGVPPPHPLIKNLLIEIHTEGAEPKKALKEAVNLSLERISELLTAVKQTFPHEQSKTAESQTTVDYQTSSGSESAPSSY